MSKKTAKVQHRQLYLNGSDNPVCAVGSPAWFAWLEAATTFRYHSQERQNIFRGYGPLLPPISLRKEERRRGALWYAYKRRHGCLHKRYVGRSARLTLAKLDDVALRLNQFW
jgi:LuxR family maltose regulon positive regulatory protein